MYNVKSVLNMRSIVPILSIIILISLISGCSPYPLGAGRFDFLLIPVTVLAAIIIGSLLLIIPIEIILLGGVISGILAAAVITEGSPLYYLRFLPNIVISVRVYLYITTSQAGRILLPTAIVLPFGLLSIFALVSAAYSSSPNLTAQRAISMLLAIIAFGIALPAYLCRKPERLRRLILWIGFILAVSALIGIFDPLISGNINRRLSGIFNNPNTLGMVAMIGFFPLLGYWPTSRGIKRIVITGVLIMLIVAVLVSGSRASLLGISVGIVSIILFSTLNKKSRAAFLLLLTIVLMILAILYLNFDLLSLSINRTDDSGRLAILEYYISYGLEAPLFGHGFNEITSVSRESLVSFEDYLSSRNPFNSYILIFTGLGFTGLIITLWGFSWIILRSLRTLTKLQHPWFFLTLLSGILASMVHAFFESWLFSFGNAPTIPFWILLTVLCLYAQHPELYSSNYDQSEKSASR